MEMSPLEVAAKLHQRAMNSAELADLAKLNGNLDAAASHLREAGSAESQAALLLKDHLELEPTRSVLFRSATSLTMECGDLSKAAQMVFEGLSGSPPDDIYQELRDLLDKLSHSLDPTSPGVLADVLKRAGQEYRTGNAREGDKLFQEATEGKSAEFAALAYQKIWDLPFTSKGTPGSTSSDETFRLVSEMVSTFGQVDLASWFGQNP